MATRERSSSDPWLDEWYEKHKYDDDWYATAKAKGCRARSSSDPWLDQWYAEHKNDDAWYKTAEQWRRQYRGRAQSLPPPITEACTKHC